MGITRNAVSARPPLRLHRGYYFYDMSIVSNLQSKKRIPVLQVVKTLIATFAAWFMAAWVVPGQLPIFAAIAAIIVIQPSVNQSLGKALERSTGTIVGVALALGASLIFGAPSWLVLLTIAAAIIGGWIFKITPATSNQIAISAMLVIAIGAATPEYAFDRIVETLIGATVAFVVNAVIAPPVALQPSYNAIGLLGSNIADIFEDISRVLTTSSSYEDLSDIHVRSLALRAQLNKAQSTLSSAEESLRFNAFKGKHAQELAHIRTLLDQLAVLVNRTIGVTRAVRDNYDDSVVAEPGISQIAREFDRAGHDLRILVRDAGLPAMGSEHPPTQEIPALTSPISVKAPSGANWILVGFLMENLRRIRSEIMSGFDAENA